ncbi:MAG: hypothetical protein ABFD89_06740 [Bryobacteraceae bacterium]
MATGSTEKPTTQPNSWLRLAYTKAQELRAEFADASWSRGMTGRDHRTIGQLQAKSQNLERLIYQAMQAPLPMPDKETEETNL